MDIGEKKEVQWVLRSGEEVNSCQDMLYETRICFQLNVVIEILYETRIYFQLNVVIEFFSPPHMKDDHFIVCVLDTFVKGYIDVSMWVYFQVFYSIQLVIQINIG